MKKLIFDFDGTLVDSMKIWGGSMIKVLEDNGIDYPENIVQILTPLGYIGSARYFRENLGLIKPENEIIAEISSYAVKDYAERITAKPYVKGTLLMLKEKGFSMNVLTASPHKMLDICLKRNGLYELFDNVWSCDDFFTTKSDPNIYHMAANELGADALGCAFFDDNISALQCAKSAGVTVIGVYDESSSGQTEQIKMLSHAYIKDFSEIEKTMSILKA